VGEWAYTGEGSVVGKTTGIATQEAGGFHSDNFRHSTDGRGVISPNQTIVPREDETKKRGVNR